MRDYLANLLTIALVVLAGYALYVFISLYLILNWLESPLPEHEEEIPDLGIVDRLEFNF